MFGTWPPATLTSDPDPLSPGAFLVITKSLAALTAATGLIAVGVVPAATQAATPHRPPSQAQLQRALDKTVSARVPGAVLVTHHRGHTVRVAAGVSDVQHGSPMRTGARNFRFWLT